MREMLVLASGSPIRHQMLDAAGIAHEVVPSEVDESAIKARHGEDDHALARALALAKAQEIASRLSEKWVIGGDSLVSVEGRRFDKPRDRQEAIAHLRFFSGKTLRLTSAAALVRNGDETWSHSDHALLHLRHLGDEFIHNYLESEWPAVSGCVGVFRMEGRGVQLFERIEGSHFTILGLPLVPLLAALRERGLVA